MHPSGGLGHVHCSATKSDSALQSRPELKGPGLKLGLYCTLPVLRIGRVLIQPKPTTFYES